jgi:hypothetical protein
MDACYDALLIGALASTRACSGKAETADFKPSLRLESFFVCATSVERLHFSPGRKVKTEARQGLS